MTQNAQEEETACLTHPVIKQGRQDRAGVGCTNRGTCLGMRGAKGLPFQQRLLNQAPPA